MEELIAVMRDLCAAIDRLECRLAAREEIGPAQEPLTIQTTDPVLDLPLEELEVSIRVANCFCRRFGRNGTVRDLLGVSRQELRRTYNFGKVSLKEVEAILDKLGLKLRPR